MTDKPRKFEPAGRQSRRVLLSLGLGSSREALASLLISLSPSLFVGAFYLVCLFICVTIPDIESLSTRVSIPISASAPAAVSGPLLSLSAPSSSPAITPAGLHGGDAALTVSAASAASGSLPFPSLSTSAETDGGTASSSVVATDTTAAAAASVSASGPGPGLPRSPTLVRIPTTIPPPATAPATAPTSLKPSTTSSHTEPGTPIYRRPRSLSFYDASTSSDAILPQNRHLIQNEGGIGTSQHAAATRDAATRSPRKTGLIITPSGAPNPGFKGSASPSISAFRRVVSASASARNRTSSLSPALAPQYQPQASASASARRTSYPFRAEDLNAAYWRAAEGSGFRESIDTRGYAPGGESPVRGILKRRHAVMARDFTAPEKKVTFAESGQGEGEGEVKGELDEDWLSELIQSVLRVTLDEGEGEASSGSHVQGSVGQGSGGVVSARGDVSGGRVSGHVVDSDEEDVFPAEEFCHEQ
ncbi:hypothetical protein P170DRAFT_466469 [Aspergillus steynii IBT 23096]|uniref:Uncharacterized protein n=1 Tax=Aspergillus steynii IBT 23096 TaxID=1392250 RepID=A0A2I2G2N7_9EURO|nr:uncharacterized protein P170DRAFT_466469 [Aspergillus steynii IBT 23096]PLB47144.1 hypothetical protein P170DRAFT_466469 [Aspergillus steynii IBT 23096]